MEVETEGGGGGRNLRRGEREKGFVNGKDVWGRTDGGKRTTTQNGKRFSSEQKSSFFLFSIIFLLPD